MKPARFSYCRPRDAVEAVAMMNAADDDARFLAGGQSLVPMMNFRIVRPSTLVDLSRCDDIAFVRRDSDKLRLGAMTRQRDVETSDIVKMHCPIISEALGHAGPLTVRNCATIGGTIANAYPVAELPVVAVCLDAEMIVLGSRGERTIAAADFFVAGMMTDLTRGELLREVVFPAFRPETRYAVTESGNHAGGAALAMAAAVADREEGGKLRRVSIAVAGLRTVPIRLSNVENACIEGARSGPLRDAYAADLQALDDIGEGEEADADQRKLVWALVEDAIVRLASPQKAEEALT